MAPLDKLKNFISLPLALLLAAPINAAGSFGRFKELLPLNPSFKDAQYSVYAKYAGGPVVISINPNLRLAPASVLKLYTTAAALDILGPNYRFETRLYLSGLQKGQKLFGNLYIRGGGDPTLGSIRLPGTPALEELTDSWVAAVKAQGVRVIEGDLYGDNSLFSGVTLPWRTSWQNIGNYFAAPADALSVRDNTYEIYFEPARQPGQITNILRMDPAIKDLNVKSFVTSYEGSGRSIYVNLDPSGTGVEVFGDIKLSDKPLEVAAAMPNPALFLAEYLAAKLRANGVEVKGDIKVFAPYSYDNKRLLLTHQSPPLSEIVKYTNKRSFNLYADILLRALSAHKGGPGTAGDGVLQIKDFLSRNKIDIKNFDVFDGSGLSRDNITSCRATVQLLEYARKQSWGKLFWDSLPLAGDPYDNSSMARRLRRSSAAYNARVKTGTLDRARSHAGYINDSNGKEIAFCIVTNNFAGPLWQTNDAHESIINALSQAALK